MDHVANNQLWVKSDGIQRRECEICTLMKSICSFYTFSLCFEIQDLKYKQTIYITHGYMVESSRYSTKTCCGLGWIWIGEQCHEFPPQSWWFCRIFDNPRRRFGINYSAAAHRLYIRRRRWFNRVYRRYRWIKSDNPQMEHITTSFDPSSFWRWEDWDGLQRVNKCWFLR